jgi:hypothetical protein
VKSSGPIRSRRSASTSSRTSAATPSRSARRSATARAEALVEIVGGPAADALGSAERASFPLAALALFSIDLLVIYGLASWDYREE